MSDERIFINCPFDEKDEAKKQGAKWDGGNKKWFIPKNLYNQIERFNQWKPKGRMYLNCPFSDKDKAKKKGAKWDRAVGKWFFYPGKSVDQKKFEEWLPGQSSGKSSVSSPPIKAEKPSYSQSPLMGMPHSNTFPPQITEMPSYSQSQLMGIPHSNAYPHQVNVAFYPPQPPPMNVPSSGTFPPQMDITSSLKQSSSTKDDSKTSTPVRKSLPVAALPRINKDMTIKQLQQECRARDPAIKGISNKNKQWFLDHLGIGSVWISIGSEYTTEEEEVGVEQTTLDQNSGKKRTLESVTEEESPLNKKPKMTKIKYEDALV